MHKSILFALLCGLAVFAVACGPGNNSAKGNGTGNAAGGGGGEAGEAADAYALYKKKGRNWTHKTVNKIAGMDDMVSFTKVEVTDVNEKEASTLTTMMDKDKKPMAGVEPQKGTIPFKAADTTAPKGDAPKVETKEEKMKAAGVDFDCIVTETDAGGTKSKTWSSKKYPGLVVKMEAGGMTMELVEFNE